MVLCYKISDCVHIMDIKTMQTQEIDKATFWQTEFTACLSRERMSEFVVINIENVDNNFNESRAALR